MDTKQHVTLEVTKGDYTFTFTMPLGSTWGSALDAAFDVLQHVTKLSKDAVEQLKPGE